MQDHIKLLGKYSLDIKKGFFQFEHGGKKISFLFCCCYFHAYLYYNPEWFSYIVISEVIEKKENKEEKLICSATR
jgi:hypothetical protein